MCAWSRCLRGGHYLAALVDADSVASDVAGLVALAHGIGEATVPKLERLSLIRARVEPLVVAHAALAHTVLRARLSILPRWLARVPAIVDAVAQWARSFWRKLRPRTVLAYFRNAARHPDH